MIFAATKWDELIDWTGIRWDLTAKEWRLGVEPSEKGIDLMNKWWFHPEKVGCLNWLTIKNDEKIEIQLTKMGKNDPGNKESVNWWEFSGETVFFAAKYGGVLNQRVFHMLESDGEILVRWFLYVVTSADTPFFWSPHLGPQIGAQV